ncbi:hypothetical protein ACFPZ0_08055 [Streptomonospora nanhaiensis]|uniref:hypothetical protein n=1 Tax=Streptomonospora nanhaiensis TaxID=1323731 RepID=UPI001C391A3C|nr:hypothetical protein [Streptomonospora nanhaiensis]MBV2366249.1 hypothetical protein [Streptomonospora nanhaiensis]MBX9391810.1 hypothetical protein [Streptomonospora nanhaiensis]
MTDREEDEPTRRKRLDLSVPQVVGAGVATLTAATLASFLGVYGTIIGAAVMSVLSTAGTAVFQHLAERGSESARNLAARTGGRRHDSARGELARSGPGAADGDTLLAAATETDTAPGARSERASGREDLQRTRALPTLGGAAPTGTAGGHRTRAPGEQTGPRAWWRRWRFAAVPAAAVFLAAMAAILVFELFTGQSLSDTVRGSDTGSAPTLLGGGQADGAEDPAPDTEATPGGETGTAPPTGPAGPAEPQEGTGQVPVAPEEDGGVATPEDGSEPTTDPGATPDPGTGGTGTGDTGEQQPQTGTGQNGDLSGQPAP